jgi:hypothetical protein
MSSHAIRRIQRGGKKPGARRGKIPGLFKWNSGGTCQADMREVHDSPVVVM